MGVALSVLQHGWREFRQQGAIDPELLTLGYLVMAVTRSQPLRGAGVAWAASFGRHLLQDTARGVEVRPVVRSGPTNLPQAYQVKPVQHRSRQAPLLTETKALLRFMGLMVTHGTGTTLLEDLIAEREMATADERPAKTAEAAAS